MTDAPIIEAGWFGQDDRACFGMLHHPARPTTSGVILCAALGYEGLLGHRAYRRLAEQLTTRGLTVLRLDYSGTGDSGGDGGAPGQVPSWLASIDDAVHLLRDAHGITDIHLVGLRVGATLAWTYAQKHPGLSSLVLWNPCVRGATYVRELKALARLSAAARPPQRVDGPQPADGSLEVVGFEVTADTLDALASLDMLTRAEGSSAPRTLVLDRSDAPVGDALVTSIQSGGVEVRHELFDGWAGFMVDDETRSTLPDDTLERITAWFDPVEPGLIPHQPSTRARAILEGPDLRFREEPVWLPQGLFGILTTPADRTTAPSPGVVLLNTGASNRTGPGRLHVEIARRWAADGATVVRVDLGGTGDGPLVGVTSEQEPYLPERADEASAVVAWLRDRPEVGEVSVMGICSGAYNAFHAALHGAAIDRLVLVNQAIFYLGADESVEGSAGKAVMTANSVKRALVSRSARRQLRGGERHLSRSIWRAMRGFALITSISARRALGGVGVAAAEVDPLPHDLRLLADRGTRITAVFAAGESGSTYLRLFGGSTLGDLERTGRALVVDVDGGDHVFSPPTARRRLVEILTEAVVACSPIGLPQQESGMR